MMDHAADLRGSVKNRRLQRVLTFCLKTFPMNQEWPGLSPGYTFELK
jgi:hypothetical protein